MNNKDRITGKQKIECQNPYLDETYPADILLYFY